MASSGWFVAWRPPLAWPMSLSGVTLVLQPALILTSLFRSPSTDPTAKTQVTAKSSVGSSFLTLVDISDDD